MSSLESDFDDGVAKECSLTTLSKIISECSSEEIDRGACALFSFHRGLMIAWNIIVSILFFISYEHLSHNCIIRHKKNH